MRLLKLLLKLTVVLGSLWMLYLMSHPKTDLDPTYSLRYSWLEYTDADGGPEKVCNCTAIMQGVREALKQAKLLTITKDFRKNVRIPDEHYINATRDCRKFKLTRKYLTFPLSQEEEDFPLAYSMVVHHKVQNFERLLRAIYAPQNIYCIHVDEQSQASVFSAISAITSCFPNVYMVSQRATGKAKKPPPFNLPILSGNAYIVVSRGYVRSVLEDNRILALMEWAKDTFSPDEFLWATIQRIPGVPGSTWPNRKHDMTDINAIARLVKWQWHEGSQGSLEAVYPECHGKHVRSICVYGAGDLQWLLEHHHLFANKFDTDTDPIALYCLEKYLRQKALAELQP
ncbi:beta-1,3-galactosyl-O-glycosyl-glycoprotein beta-1,6-N-acetylglucosaminyltransferase-like isoform X2 [Micropterus dolomieu]|uniref:beta-1,3-galactosyl-O-glycosyl-glycoprotein beta-1,6-N-acetylglucosaminyltransferase-like isoform X2 n=1 Tax=Micropterus dolomieu TaxID=147949 RepID=UPI001E8D9CE5|nr:beta-1,3-galactosyl-O-glycosyl-glycoprotein beta-1,6-N-acetylglucosaminyltransferase-like isoform X2 [Micropterus dolomieu]